MEWKRVSVLRGKQHDCPSECPSRIRAPAPGMLSVLETLAGRTWVVFCKSVNLNALGSQVSELHRKPRITVAMWTIDFVSDLGAWSTGTTGCNAFIQSGSWDMGSAHIFQDNSTDLASWRLVSYRLTAHHTSTRHITINKRKRIQQIKVQEQI